MASRKNLAHTVSAKTHAHAHLVTATLGGIEIVLPGHEAAATNTGRRQ